MTENKRKWIYVRYLYPVVSMLVITALLFIPCYSFVTDGGANDPVSVLTLTKNSWDWGTQCLWGIGIEQSLGNIYFSQTVLIMVIAFYLAFIIALGASIYLCASAFMCFRRTPFAEKNRIILITFFFNRTVVSILQTLAFPIFIFPKLLPFVYLSTLNTYVEMRLEFIDPLLISAFLYAAGVVISVITAPWEKKLDMDIFKKPSAKVVEEEKNGEDLSESKPESALEIMNRKAREEQAEKILELLNKNEKDK